MESPVCATGDISFRIARYPTRNRAGQGSGTMRASGGNSWWILSGARPRGLSGKKVLLRHCARPRPVYAIRVRLSEVLHKKMSLFDASSCV